MNNSKGILLSSAMAAAFLSLTACGGSDSGSASAPAPAATAPAPAPEAAAPAEEMASEGFDISTVEKAEGVVYQDEIYANWPYN